MTVGNIINSLTDLAPNGRNGHSSVADESLLRGSEQATDEHFVQFYETDVFLLDSITRFISIGLNAGEAALILATDTHLKLLRARLEEQGLDVDGLAQLGRLITLDTEEVQTQLTLADGSLSAERFNDFFSGLIAQASEGQRPLRVSGELVAVLLAQGKHESAIEVEQWWNGLKKTKRFSLFCAYPLNGFGANELSEHLKQVCLTHSRVIPSESYSLLKEPEDQLRAIALLQQKAISLTHEITERHRTEERLRKVQEELQLQLVKADQWLKLEQVARSEAEVANRMKDEFLATVSHELRTPLNAIIGWSHMLNRGRLDADTSVRAIDSIERNAKSQAQLVEDLLDVSRMVTGKLRLNLATVNVGSVINAAVDSVQLAADSKEIKLDVILDSGQEIVGDANRLQQIVWNLLSNAIKFTPARGRVTVQLKPLDNDVEITVADTGQGMEPEFLHCAFDRFRQADATSTRRHGGLGLGLAIVRHLAELHGGEVSVESPGLELGSTFVVRLPIAARFRRQKTSESPNATQHSEDKAIVPISLAGLRVLVVDDDADSLQMLTAILEQKDAQVEAANSAAAAVDLLETFEPDIFVLDLEMPDEDGFSMIAKIRERDEVCGTNCPAVALTTHVRVEDRVRALSAGFNMFVPKPIQGDELIAAIASLTQLAKGSSA